MRFLWLVWLTQGCAYISAALAFNDVCEVVDMSKNGIGTDGILASTAAPTYLRLG